MHLPPERTPPGRTFQPIGRFTDEEEHMPEDTVHIRPTILYCIGRDTLEAVAVPTHNVAPSNTESSIVERVYRLRTETITMLIRMRPTSLKVAAVVAFVLVAGVVGLSTTSRYSTQVIQRLHRTNLTVRASTHKLRHRQS